MSNRAWEIVFVAACALAVTAANVWTADPDVFWHLKVGEWIIQNRAVPETDVYSWSACGQPWTAHEWLWEAAICVLHDKLGVAGLWSVVFAAGLSAGLAIRAALAASGVSGTVASIAGGAAPLLLGECLKPWPQAGVYALFSVYLHLSLKRAWNGKTLLALFAVSAAWANIHSSAVMLPFLLAAEAAWRALNKEKPGPLLAAALVSAAGTLANPHGAGIWAYAVREGLMTHEYRAHIAEWMPFFFGVHGMAGAFFISITVLFSAACQGRVKTLEFARAAGFWTLALLSRIYLPFAVLSTAALLGLLKIDFRRDCFKLATVLVVAFGITMLAVRGMPGDLEAAAERCGYPVRAVEFLEGQPYEKLFNDYTFGGYLIWKGIPVYLDGRADLYKYGDIFKKYVNLPGREESVSSYIEGTGADVALLAAKSPADRAMMESNGWECLYRDESAAVYRKRQKG